MDSGEVMDDEEIYEHEIIEELARTLNFPKIRDTWVHDDQTWTRDDLAKLFNVGNQSATAHAEAAVKSGQMVKGGVRGHRGHFITAYRFPDHPALQEDSTD